MLRAALNQARKWQLVSENAAALIDPPRCRPKRIRPLTPEQARTLLDAVKEHRLADLVSVAMAVGLRIGEALGLEWSAVNLDAGTVTVRQVLQRSGGDKAARRPLAMRIGRIRAVPPDQFTEGSLSDRGSQSPTADGSASWR